MSGMLSFIVTVKMPMSRFEDYPGGTKWRDKELEEQIREDMDQRVPSWIPIEFVFAYSKAHRSTHITIDIQINGSFTSD